jgi:GNAT superfamily N-acetyltransferase
MQIIQANRQHQAYSEQVCRLIETAAHARGTGIAQRNAAYIREKMERGHAVIALDGKRLVGFCYIETWSDRNYVVNSGLVVDPDYRRKGLAKKIKRKAFEVSRQLFPDAKLFGITTSLAVMKINTDLGYRPVTFSELTHDHRFWDGCRSCPNFDVLNRTKRTMCLCTAMLYQADKES